MESQQQSSSAVKELFVINNDRSEGYKTAANETKDADLKSLFNEFSSQSQGFATALRPFVGQTTDQPKNDETKPSGKIYRAWMDIKAAVTGKDRKAILSSCEYGEDVAKEHYENVLKNPQNIAPEALELIRKQSVELRKSHDTIKSLRDSTK
jgi:uncharacterized protein (TIGR02284 family)